jgi:TRAP-type transport system periplasmic protein
MKRSIAVAIAVAWPLALAAVAPMRASAEPMQLKFASPAPPMSPVTRGGLIPWAKSVTEASEGTLDIKVFAGPTVAKFDNVLDRVENAVVDIGFGVLGSYASQFPMTQVVALPFESDDPLEAGVALWNLYAKGAIADDYKRVRPLTLFVFPSGAMHLKRPVRTMEDLKGLKIGLSSRMIGQLVERLGATPIAMQPTEYYPSMQRGLVDGIVIGWAAAFTFKIPEVTNFHLGFAAGSSPACVFINNDSWARLPAKGKETILALSGTKFSKTLGHITGRDPKAYPGHEIYKLPPAEATRWKAAIKPVVDEWIKATPNGEKVLEAFQAELAAVHAETMKEAEKSK